MRTRRCRPASGLIISSASPFTSSIIVLTAQVTIDGLVCSMVSKVAPSMYILFPGGTDLSFSRNSVRLRSSVAAQLSRISPINGFVVPLSIAFTAHLCLSVCVRATTAPSHPVFSSLRSFRKVTTNILLVMFEPIRLAADRLRDVTLRTQTITCWLKSP